MALIDVGSDIHRRASARAMTFLHSAGFDEAQKGFERVSANLPRGEPIYGRSEHFYKAAMSHHKGTSESMRQQKIPARGIVREQIAPRTDPRMTSMGSKN